MRPRALAPTHDILVPLVRMPPVRMHMPRNWGEVVGRIVWVNSSTGLWLEQIANRGVRSGLGLPAIVRQGAPNLPMAQKRARYKHQVCQTARRILRLAGKPSHPDVLPRMMLIS